MGTFAVKQGLGTVTDCARYRLCSKFRRTDRASRLDEGVKKMDLKSRNRLQWVLSGALGASIALAPALAASGQQTTQQTPTPGQQGDWGQAGPPPDVQNGQIPPPDSAAQDQNQNADQGPPQYPGQTADQNQDPNQPPPPPPPAASGPGVGYGQPPRPAYQPGQPIQRIPGSAGCGPGASSLRPGHVVERLALADSHQ